MSDEGIFIAVIGVIVVFFSAVMSSTVTRAHYESMIRDSGHVIEHVEDGNAEWRFGHAKTEAAGTECTCDGCTG